MNANLSSQATKSPFANPWVQLILGVICMASVANLQYGWTLFVNPIDAKYHWGRAAIQVAFTIFVLIETWLVPVEGYLVDRFGPKWVVLGGGILVAIAWALNSTASSLTVLYFAAAIGGVGTGCVYGTCVGNALKWFPGRRGLAAGITASGFGAGAALTIVPISHMIDSSGYEQAFLFFGLLQGGIVFVVSWMLLTPPPSLIAAKVKPNQTAHGYTPTEVLKTPVFYLMYFMFVLIASGGLTMAASMAPIAKDFKIDKVPVDLFGVTMAGAGVCAGPESHLRRRRPALLRLAVRSDRPRIHHGSGFHAGRRRALHVEPVGNQPGAVRAGHRAVTSACTAKSSACSRQPPAIPSARNLRPPITACCTRPRERARCSCRTRHSSRRRMAGRRYSRLR